MNLRLVELREELEEVGLIGKVGLREERHVGFDVWMDFET